MIEVVAAALIADGRVLAARRRTPPGWEFPGGKIEAGETPQQALTRECREELGIAVTPTTLLGAAPGDGFRLQLWQVETDDRPVAGADHHELRWVGVAELDGLDWLAVDRALLGVIRPQLS